MPEITIDRQLEKAVLDGLTSFVVGASQQPLVPRERIRPLRGQRQVPQKPYILYGFFTPWQHPGRLVGFNPPAPVGVVLEPTTTLTASGTTSDFLDSQTLIDRTKDFIALGVEPAYYVKVGTQTGRVTGVRQDRLFLREKIVSAAGQTYEVRPQQARVFYWVYGNKGLSLTIGADDDFQADDIAQKCRDFFATSEGVDKGIKTLGWLVWSIGEIANTDFVEERQGLVRRRDITVFLRGREVRSEVKAPLQTSDIQVISEKPVPVNPAPLLDRKPDIILKPTEWVRDP